MKRIYIAGLMRGYDNFNFDAFDKAAEFWRSRGWHPLSPAAADRALGVPTKEMADTSRPFLNFVMAIDMQCIMSADAIALLPGWEDSMGSTVELAMAQFLQLEIYDALTGDVIEPYRKPWKENLKLLNHFVRRQPPQFDVDNLPLPVNPSGFKFNG